MGEKDQLVKVAVAYLDNEEIAVRHVSGAYITKTGFLTRVVEVIAEGAILELADGSLLSVPEYDRYDTGWFLLADPRHHIQRVAVQASMGLFVVVIGYVVLWLSTGFDPLATFASALQNQERLAAAWQRPYPQTIVFDLTDFAMGTGWISFLLAGLFLARHRSSPLQSHELRMAICCVGQILFVGVAGLIPTETARVWIFLMPLLMFPVGEELVRWSNKTRATVFGCMWLLLAAIHQNLVFLSLT